MSAEPQLQPQLPEHGDAPLIEIVVPVYNEEAVPVDWVEDPDSRVEIRSTALADLRGVARLAAQSQVLRFVGIGVVSTLAYALLYLALREVLIADVANAIALAVTAVGNTAANRRLTFGVRGRSGLVRHHLLGGIVFLLALALTSGALATLQALEPRPSHLLEAVVLVVASAAATMSRYVALRWWVFAMPDSAASPVSLQSLTTSSSG
ncbi:MAG: GtrA family protein [Gaiellaceae bacterium]